MRKRQKSQFASQTVQNSELGYVGDGNLGIRKKGNPEKHRLSLLSMFLKYCRWAQNGVNCNLIGIRI